MVFQNDILAGASGTAAGYTIDQSIRFNDDDSAYMSRTSGATGDRQKWTFSTWIKRGNLSSNQRLFHDSGNTNFIMFGYSSNDEFRVYLGAELRTTALFRDPSAWYHMVVAVDTTQATSSDRVKIYQNGVQITSFSATGYPSLNYNTIFNNSGTTYQISGQSVSEYFDGYISEFHWIDGQALDPTSFGEYDSVTGVWVPKAYAGSYGTNGFYITGADSADLGKDYSGNGNNFTSSGLTTADQVTDTPTENYATWNVLDKGNITTSDGNLTVTSGADQAGIRGTITIPQSGKYYWEITCNTLGYINQIGLASSSKAMSDINDGGATISNRGWEFGSWFASFNGGVTKYAVNVAGANGTNWTGVGNPAATDVLMVAYDSDNGSLWFGKNGTWFDSSGTANPATNTDPRFSGLNDGTEWFPLWAGYSTGSPNYTANFGQSGFAYTPPTGFSALSTANLPDPTIKDGSAYFQTTLYMGNGTAIGSGGNVVSQSGTNTFQPDFVWIKSRSAATDHALYDAVRGATTELISNSTNPEGTLTEGLTTFGTDGFTVGNDAAINTNTATYVAWQWLAGNGTASNTDGSITSTVSANTTAGFSIVSYTGTGSAATIGHGLGVAPAMIIVKNRDAADAWQVYHKANTAAPETDYLVLNTNAATADAADRWDDTAPTSTVFSIGNGVEVNTNTEDYIAYCFAEVEGFSKFGKYTGNGSTDGPFVWCGFRPAFVCIKVSSTTGSWLVYDTARDTYNAAKLQLFPNLTSAEDTSSTYDIDIVSNGFKIRSSNGNINTSSGTHIFMAFAENPFKYSLAR